MQIGKYGSILVFVDRMLGAILIFLFSKILNASCSQTFRVLTKLTKDSSLINCPKTNYYDVRNDLKDLCADKMKGLCP